MLKRNHGTFLIMDNSNEKTIDFKQIQRTQSRDANRQDRSQGQAKPWRRGKRQKLSTSLTHAGKEQRTEGQSETGKKKRNKKDHEAKASVGQRFRSNQLQPLTAGRKRKGRGLVHILQQPGVRYYLIRFYVWTRKLLHSHTVWFQQRKGAWQSAGFSNSGERQEPYTLRAEMG